MNIKRERNGGALMSESSDGQNINTEEVAKNLDESVTEFKNAMGASKNVTSSATTSWGDLSKLPQAINFLLKGATLPESQQSQRDTIWGNFGSYMLEGVEDTLYNIDGKKYLRNEDTKRSIPIRGN